MQISANDWKNYIDSLRKLSDVAADQMQEYINKYGFEDTEALVRYAHALVTKYGEGAAEKACQMYDAITEAEGVILPSAVPAETATFGETARAVYGSLLQSEEGKLLTSIASRLVKQAAADTTLQNAIRDGAEWAWVPSGDTCPFCIMLASRGWQKATKKVLKGGHAEHIHANCDCQFVISHNGELNIKSYDPKKFEREYKNAEGNTPKEKINSLRRAEKKEEVSSVSNEYARGNAGIGKLILNKGTTAEEIRDNETALWIHKIFGGDIECLPEIPNVGKNPDAIWNSDYWEFKKPTTQKAIDERLRKANQQITEALTRDNNLDARCGVVLDVTDINLSDSEIIDVVKNRALVRLKNNTDVIVRKNNSVLDILRVKR